jgi:hypothetical protein
MQASLAAPGFVGWVRRSRNPPPDSSRIEIMVGYAALTHPTKLARRKSYNGKLSCFFIGVSTCLSFSIASARAIRFLVECGMMTSSR